MTTPDWDRLRTEAAAVAARAHAPYSGLRVGAAALVDDGRVVTGCNVENASYGLTLCAECGLVSASVAAGDGRLLALSVVGLRAGGDDRPGRGPRILTPCGRCRQVLLEVAGPALLVDTPDGARSLGELLPDAFGPTALPDRTDRTDPADPVRPPDPEVPR